MTPFRVSQQEENLSCDINLVPLKSGTNSRPVFSRINSPPPSTQRRSLAGFLLCRSKLLQPLSGFAPFTLTFSHAESVQSVCVREAGGRERGGISYSCKPDRPLHQHTSLGRSVCLPACLSVSVLSHHRQTPTRLAASIPSVFRVDQLRSNPLVCGANVPPRTPALNRRR